MLLSLGCKTMREGVIATIIFFIAGILLILASVNIVPVFWHLNHIIMLSGFLLLLLSPIILVSTFLLSVLPDAKERMEQCNH
ncbi:MAG: hypothetical protein KAI02_04685 [Gammaproteobacteria bacterium]|nr:hypothetical protein [Gammaproteobacteria bacterium]